MLPSRSGILAEAINTKILTKNHPDSPHSPLIPRIPTLTPRTPTMIPRIPNLILCVLSLILRVPTLIPRVAIIPLIPFLNSLFQLLQIAKKVLPSVTIFIFTTEIRY